jgi:hypothetical protein
MYCIQTGLCHHVISTYQELVSSLIFCLFLLTYSIYLTPWNGSSLTFHASISKPLTILWLLQYILSPEPTLALTEAVGFLYTA